MFTYKILLDLLAVEDFLLVSYFLVEALAFLLTPDLPVVLFLPEAVAGDLPVDFLAVAVFLLADWPLLEAEATREEDLDFLAEAGDFWVRTADDLPLVLFLAEFSI